MKTHFLKFTHKLASCTLLQLCFFQQSSSPDHGRGIRYRGAEYQSVYNMLMMLIPGIVVTYYGEEIGMDQSHLDGQSQKDIMARYNLTVSK